MIYGPTTGSAVFWSRASLWIMNRVTAAKQLTIVFFLLIFTGSLMLEKAEAYFQTGFSPVQLRAKTIAGTVTLNGKPIDGAVLTLHRFLGAYSIELYNADTHVLGRAIATKDGRFRFAEVPSGKFVVFVRGTSVEVDLVKPKSGESDMVLIENFADSCVSATVISAGGRKLMHWSPSMCW